MLLLVKTERKYKIVYSYFYGIFYQHYYDFYLRFFFFSLALSLSTPSVARFSFEFYPCGIQTKNARRQTVGEYQFVFLST